MKAGETFLLPFLDGKKQFIIPIYQRTYSWTRPQCEQLWNDIVRVATDPEADSHFVGSIVHIQHGLPLMGGIMQSMVIDGQQRITTIMLLLLALAQASSNASSVSRDDLYESYLVNKFGKGELRYKLLLTQHDRNALIQLTDTPEYAQQITQAPRLLENYLFFTSRIQASAINPDTLYIGISKLMIVEIALGREDNPQLIFESLNSTGMDLSQADLIRNYVLMRLHPKDQERLYNDYWYRMEQLFHGGTDAELFDRFMRDYLTIKQGTIPNIKEVYANFKSYHHSKAGQTIEELVKDIYRYADYFANLMLGYEADRDVKRAMRRINTLKVDVAYPFLLEVYDDYAHKLLSRTDLLEILELVEAYVFRRSICGIPTNSLNKVFAVLAHEIDKEHYLPSLKAALLSKTVGARFPRNDEFMAAFVVRDVYNYPRRNYLLDKLENFERKEHVYVEGYTIEHILPQNKNLSSAWQQELGPNWKEIQERYLHTVGNLTLTGYNSELSDRPFLDKRDHHDGGFAHSPLRLNEYLASLEHWNEEEIKQRAALQAERAVKIWPIPQMPDEQVKRFSKQGAKPLLAEVIGPIEHSLLGFVPDGFRLVQTSEKRFYLFRKVNNEWIQYGNGKNPWFAISWNYAKGWIQEKYEKNEMPLGIGGENVYDKIPLAKDKLEQTDYSTIETFNGKSYGLDDYPHLKGEMLNLFEQLRKRILNLDASVHEECKKMYIAYKTTTNFVDIEPQKKCLRLSLNMPFENIHDPLALCHNITGIGHYGNGDIAVSLIASNQLDAVMELIRQAYEWQQDDSEL